MIKAIFPGMFDPITFGHLDIIERAAPMFGSIIVTIGWNPDKDALFDQPERAEMAQLAIGNLPNVSVRMWAGLSVDFAKLHDAQVIIRGVRNTSDCEYEYTMANINRSLGGIETIFIPSLPELAMISSSMVREIAVMRGDVSQFVPTHVAIALEQETRIENVYADIVKFREVHNV